MRLPTGSAAYLAELRRLYDAREHDELNEGQRKLADALLAANALAIQRKQYLSEMVAAGWTDAEIKLTFASPDSPMTVLITGFKGKNVATNLQKEIAAARNEMKSGGEEARRRAYVRLQYQLLEQVWVAIGEAGATHKHSLITLANGLMQAIGIAEGVVVERAGRKRTKQAEAVDEEEPEEEPSEDKKPWEEFEADDEIDDSE